MPQIVADGGRVALVFNVWTLPHVLIVLVAVSLAILVYRAAPRRPENRLLAVLLYLHGGTSLGAIALYATNDPRVTMGGQAVIELVVITLTFLVYPWFLAAIDTPLARPFRTRTFRVVSLLATLALVAAFFVRPSLYVAGVIQPWYAHYDAVFGPWSGAYQQVAVLFMFYFLALTIDAWRRAPRGSLRRQQAGTFAVAFGIVDGFTGLMFLQFMFIPYGNDRVLDLVFLAVVPVIQLSSYSILAYGLLRLQLFDIDLKVKMALRRSTVLGAFAVTFLVVSELVEAVLQVEGTFFGLAAAIGLGILFRRVERLGALVADRLMRGVHDTPTYRDERRRALYRNALETLGADGDLTPDDRAFLDALRGRLAIGPEEAAALEHHVAGARGRSIGATSPG